MQPRNNKDSEFVIKVAINLTLQEYYAKSLELIE